MISFCYQHKQERHGLSNLTQQIKTYCLDLIMAQVNDTYNAAAEYLSGLADQASHPHDRQLYIETIHSIGFDRRKVMTSFEKQMERAFDDLTGAPGTTQHNKVGGIDTSSISGLKNIEEKLALETMISKARTKTELPMNSIVRSLNALMGDDWAQKNQNPLDPELLIKAWLVSIHRLELPLKANLALFGLFDVQMLTLLPKLLERIGQYLEQLPIRKNTKQTQSNIDDSFDSYEDDFGDIDEPTSMPYFAGNDSSEEVEEPVTDDGIDYDEEPVAELHTDELVRLLDNLQRNRELDDSVFYRENYLLDYRALLESFDAISGKKISPWTIGQINDDVIDMTSLLFSFIMEDAHLPDDVRYHISRLQIPYLKLGLQDKSIFSNKVHPARQLLNDLAESISLWDPTHTGGLDLLLSETMKVIDGVLNNYMMDPFIFSEYQTRFNDFLSGDAHIDDEMQQRQKDTATKTAKADNARLYIDSILDKICDNKRIPPIINQILEEYWSKVLFLEYLKAGDQSDDFTIFLETTKILVDSVQSKGSADARKDMAKELPNLIRRLKAGLTTISVAAFETVDIFRGLQECHMLVLKERPELEEVDEFEVDDTEYEEFKHDQTVIRDWNRADLESALLEESIERSLNTSDIDPYAFDDNKNIIHSSQDMVHDATIAKASREREIIDNELKEARDAYEQALKEHQAKNTETSDEADDSDDFMAQFFQDPEFIKKQYAGTRDLSSSSDSHLLQKSDDLVIEDDVFDALEEGVDEPLVINLEPVSANDEATMQFENESKVAHEIQDDLSGRAHGALENEFNELGDDQVSELVARLKVGLWVDLYHADGTQVRAKIMAIIPTVGKYIFGDRSGRKVADFSKLSLADALRKGSIRVSEEDNAFDKTLESVIANLRVLKKAEDE